MFTMNTIVEACDPQNVPKAARVQVIWIPMIILNEFQFMDMNIWRATKESLPLNLCRVLSCDATNNLIGLL